MDTPNYAQKVWAGRDVFVLWVRDTQSLWWPVIGKAVSGPLIDTPMKVLDPDFWAQTTWGRIRKQFPEALVVQRNQTMAPPTPWPKIEVVAVTESSKEQQDGNSTVPADAIAPRWSENTKL